MSSHLADEIPPTFDVGKKSMQYSNFMIYIEALNLHNIVNVYDC